MIVAIVRDSLIYAQVARAFRHLKPDEWRVIAIEPSTRDFDAPVDTTYLDVNYSGVDGVYSYGAPSRNHSLLVYEAEVSALHVDDHQYANIPKFYWSAIHSGIRRLDEEIEDTVSADDTVVTWNERLWFNEVTVDVCENRVIRMERGPIGGTYVVDGMGLDEGRNDFQQLIWPQWADRRYSLGGSDMIETWVGRYTASKETLEEQSDWVSPLKLRNEMQTDCLGFPLVFAPLQVPLDTNVVFRGGSNERLIEFVGAGSGTAQSFAKRHPGDKWTRDEWLEDRCAEQSVWVRDDNVTSLIETADCVVTMNSQVGIEALIRGKPVGVLGSAYWSGCGVTLDIPLSVRDVLEFVPERDEILKFLQALVFDYLRSPEQIPARIDEIKSRW